MENVKVLIEEVNKILQDGEPGNVSLDEYTSFTGYKPQAIIDAMNSVFELGQWGFEEVSSSVEGAEKGVLVVSQVRVSLAGVAFQPTSWGQARVTRGDIGDARKGAQTDAIKKGLSYFSIGNRAYHGLLIAPPKGQQQAKPSPVRNTPIKPETKKVVPQQDLASIPSVNQLKKEAEQLGYSAWANVLKQSLKPLDDKALKTLVDLGSELPPDQCKVVAAHLQRMKERAKSGAA